MAALTEKKTWRRETPGKRSRCALTNDEREAVKVALRALAIRHKGYRGLADVLGVARANLANVLTRRGRPSADLAIRTARLTGATIDEVLGGRWPPDGLCMYCGHRA